MKIIILGLICSVVIKQGFAQKCITCRGKACEEENEPIECTRHIPELPSMFKTDVDLKPSSGDYKCLSLTYLDNDLDPGSKQAVKQCIISEEENTLCNLLNLHSSVLDCDIKATILALSEDSSKPDDRGKNSTITTTPGQQTKPVKTTTEVKPNTSNTTLTQAITTTKEAKTVTKEPTTTTITTTKTKPTTPPETTPTETTNSPSTSTSSTQTKSTSTTPTKSTTSKPNGSFKTTISIFIIPSLLLIVFQMK